MFYIVLLCIYAQLTYAGHNSLEDFSSKYCKKSEDYNRNLILSDRSRGENYVYNPNRIEESRPHWEVSTSIIPYANRGIQIPDAAIKKIQYADVEVRAIKADIDRQLLQIRDILRSEPSVYQRYEIVLHLETLATAFDSYYERLQRRYQFDNQDLYIEKNLHGVECLREELHNLLNSIMVEFFDADGVLLDKNPDSLILNLTSRLQLIFHHRTIKKLIARYDRLYENGYIARIPSVDRKRLEFIKNHPVNKAFAQIDMSLTRGNLDQVDKICKQFELNKKYFRILQSFKTSSGYLNEYGLPKVWESHPDWQRYEQELIGHSSDRSAIIQVLQHDNNKAYELCDRAGIEMPTAAQLNYAHQLGQYHTDPSFLDIASQGLQDKASFEKATGMFDQRANVLAQMQDIAVKYPDSMPLLQQRMDKLVLCSHDPEFLSILNEMASSPDKMDALYENLLDRDLYVHELRKQLGFPFFTEHTEEIAYQLAGTKNDVERIEILHNVCMNHNDDYLVFYDTKTHLPKLFTYDQQLLLTTRLPACFGTQYFAQERKFYTQVMTQPLTCHEEFLQAQQCISLFKDACVPQENQAVYRDLACTAAQTYLHKAYNTTPADRVQQVELFDRACRAIEQGDITQADIPARSVQVAESVGKQTIHVDYRQLYEMTVGQCVAHQDGILADHYQSREHALRQIVEGNSALYKRTYELSPQAQKILEKNGLDLAQFTTCTGNVLQQDTHAKFVQTLNTLAQKPVLTGATQQIKEGVLECAQAGSQLNQNGNVKEAMILSDFCHVAVEYLWQGIDASIAVSKGVAEGVYVGVSSEIAKALRDPHALQETFLTEGSWSEPDLRDRVVMETATIVADLVRLVKDAGEIVESGALGVGDAIVEFPKLVSNCLEVTKVTGQSIGLITLKLAIILYDVEQGDIEAIERNAQTLHNTCEQVSQGINDYLAYLKEYNRQCKGGTIKEDLKGLAYFIGRTATEGAILNGCAKILNGAAQYAQSTESAMVQLQHMKDVSKAQVRNVILSTQLNLASPSYKMPGTSAAIERVLMRGVVAPEVGTIPTFVQATEKGIVKSIIPQGEASSSSSLAQKVGQYLSLEPKPGYILIPGKDGEARITNKQALTMARELGFEKTNYYSHGQSVFQKGNKFITLDVDSHNGGVWKMANSVNDLSSKKTRLGTYDKNLNRIGD